MRLRSDKNQSQFRVADSELVVIGDFLRISNANPIDERSVRRKVVADGTFALAPDDKRMGRADRVIIDDNVTLTPCADAIDTGT
jgi:hypothetical protein